jgi:hypothetical protein
LPALPVYTHAHSIHERGTHGQVRLGDLALVSELVRHGAPLGLHLGAGLGQSRADHAVHGAATTPLIEAALRRRVRHLPIYIYI